MNTTITCIRADDITSAGIIHPEIWEHIRRADFIIADVTGQNGNVMLELGVAAAWKKKEQVIILREANPEERHLFDINPARHIEYTVSWRGLQRLFGQLQEVIREAIAAVPFEPLSHLKVTLPFHAFLDDGKDVPQLYTQDLTHRRILEDCLEFGALVDYKYSWMSLGDVRVRNVRVRVEMRFMRFGSQRGFMGVMLRGQHYFANFGHLVYVSFDGHLTRTVVEDERGGHSNHDYAELKNFDPNSEEFMVFDVAMDEEALQVTIGTHQSGFPVKEMPYVFSQGRILFMAAFCHVGIRNITVEEI